MNSFTRPVGRLARRRTLLGATALVGALSVALVGCADAGASSTSGSSSSSASVAGLSSTLTAAASKRASTITGGKKIGGTVTMVGTLGGTEKERFLATLKPFEDATGITVDYTGTEDYTTVIQSGVQAGNPPDVMAVSSLNMVQQYAKEGKLVDIGSLVGDSTMSKNFTSGLLDSTTVNGKNYGIWTMLDNYAVYYNAKTYKGPKTGSWADLMAYSKKEAATGTTPWCLGLSSGSTTGWPGAYMILNQLLKQSGPTVTNALSNGTGTWDSPEVKKAFQAFGAIATDSTMVAGGASGALSADMATSGSGMYTTPQKCSLFEWGSYATSILLSADTSLKPVTDVDFFSIPASDAKYADTEGYTGTITAAFSKSAATKAFLQYEASSEAQSLIAATGNWTAANTAVAASSYPNEISKRVATQLLENKDLVALPVTSIDPAVKAALYTAVANYVQNPSTLDADLKAIDTAQAAVK
ncbi:ABC transporter substrate-binding protein [Frondihabitans cladoniiphilus]|uniref:ABC transporter substrate-binding protein n=1 Tax=Frondihabitans cladoniiphilus TaxID=715785 RepID=A0ABP8VJ14_9MICO